MRGGCERKEGRERERMRGGGGVACIYMEFLCIYIIRDWGGMEFVARGIPHEVDEDLYDKVGVVS
jgi:hypothetical protein